MTDKQLDNILRAALQSDAEPPELPQSRRLPSKRPWVGALVACLCLLLSAGAFYFMDFGASTASSDGAFEVMNQKMQSTVSAEPESAQEDAAAAGTVTMDSVMAPAAPMAPLNGGVGETCSAKSSANLWRQALKRGVKPRFDIDDYETNYIVMGDTERYHSIQVSKGEDSAYYTVDKTTCEMVALDDLLEDDSLKIIVVCRAETTNNVESKEQTKESAFYVNDNGDVVICE